MTSTSLAAFRAHARRLAVVCVLCLASTAAVADDVPHGDTPSVQLAQAKKAYNDLDYLVAVELLQSVIIDPRTTRDELVQAHLMAGVVQRIVGEDVDARLHFRRALRLYPNLRLPPGFPPKIQAFFNMVREEVDEERLAEEKALKEAKAAAAAMAERRAERRSRRGATAEPMATPAPASTTTSPERRAAVPVPQVASEIDESSDTDGAEATSTSSSFSVMPWATVGIGAAVTVTGLALASTVGVVEVMLLSMQADYAAGAEEAAVSAHALQNTLPPTTRLWASVGAGAVVVVGVGLAGGGMLWAVRE
jgi:hypothetical protein